MPYGFAVPAPTPMKWAKVDRFKRAVASAGEISAFAKNLTMEQDYVGDGLVRLFADAVIAEAFRAKVAE